jgi:hypothetical protein
MSGRYTTGSSFNASKKANSSRRHHHSGFRQGKTSAGQGHRRGQRQTQRRWGAGIAGRQGRRHHSLRQVRRTGDQLDGVEYVIMKEDDVLAAIEDISVAKDARRKR